MTRSTRIDLRDGVNGDVGCKYPCRVALMVDSPLEGLGTYNGVSLRANDIVLANLQDDAKQNGVYIASTGEWQRAVWFNNQLNVAPGSLVTTVLGTTRSATLWQVSCADNPIVFGTSEIFFDYFAAAGAGFLLASNNLDDVDSTSEARVNLGLEIGADVQEYSDNLEGFSGLEGAANKVPIFTSPSTLGLLGIGTDEGELPIVGNQSATPLIAGLTKLADISTLNAGTSEESALTPASFFGSKFNSENKIALTDAIGATNVDFTIPAGYTYQEFDFAGLLPSVNGVGLTAQYSTDNGVSFANSSYVSTGFWKSNIDALIQWTNKTSGLTLAGVDVDANTGASNTISRGGINGVLKIYNISNSGTVKHCLFEASYPQSFSSTYWDFQEGQGVYTGSLLPITNIRFTFKTLNTDTTSGTITGRIVHRGYI